MRRDLLTVLSYFKYFLYTPSFDEIYMFFPKKITRKDLQTLLKKGSHNKKILRLPDNDTIRASQCLVKHNLSTTNHSLYTLPQYSIEDNNRYHDKRILTIQRYISILKLIPCIKFVGITGRSAMNGIEKNDDLDLCIVTKHNLLWTTRFISIMLAKLLGLHSSAGVCLNLFFDESDMKIPPKKQNLYVAHELLQMKSIIDKDATHYRFLTKNKWICQYFPNAQKFAPYVTPEEAKAQPINFNSKRVILDWIPTFAGMTRSIDYLFKSIQLPIITRNRTAFYLSHTQLWLFKNDFEKKLKRTGLVI